MTDKSYSYSDQGLILGRVVATPGVAEFDLPTYLSRFQAMDFGEIPPEDRALNLEALKDDCRLMGCYDTPDGTLWIIRDAVSETGEWSITTTCLLPEDY